MTFDLFAAEPTRERLEIEDAEISLRQHIELGASPEVLLRELIEETPWRHEAVTIYGKEIMQPRLIAWYGDPAQKYSYSGIALEPLPWTPKLSNLRRIVEGALGESFNSVLLNYYRNHRDSMGFHSDDEKELGPEPVIASVSLGATRTLVFKHKTRPELKPARLALTSGSILLMKGLTQRNWKHGINKQTLPCGPRVNLTFRQIIGRDAKPVST